MTRELANHEVVTIAVYLLGGDREPGGYRGRRKEGERDRAGAIHMAQVQGSDQPRGRSRLPLGREEEDKGRISNRLGNAGWSLSEAGLAFARDNSRCGREPRAAAPREERRAGSRSPAAGARRLMATEAYAKIATGHATSDATRRRILLSDRSYVQGEARRRRVATIANAHGDDPELGPVIAQLTAMMKESNDGN